MTASGESAVPQVGLQGEFWNSEAARPWSERHALIDRLFEGITAAVLGLADPKPGEQCIDIGCGSGTTVLELARRIGTGGKVTGVDIAAASVDVANRRIRDAGLTQATVLLADLATLELLPRQIDLAFSRFGVMFFADPLKTFTRLHAAMKPDGRLAFAVFRSARENRWAVDPLAAVRDLVPPLPRPGPEEPGQFSWADEERVQRILAGAGFRHTKLDRYDPEMILGPAGGAAYAADFMMHFGPISRASAEAEPAKRQEIRTALEAYFGNLDRGGGISLPGAVWLISARV